MKERRYFTLHDPAAPPLQLKLPSPMIGDMSLVVA
jgi:hypothetical protein